MKAKVFLMYHPEVSTKKWEIHKKRPSTDEQVLFHRYYDYKPKIKQITV